MTFFFLRVNDCWGQRQHHHFVVGISEKGRIALRSITLKRLWYVYCVDATASITGWALHISGLGGGVNLFAFQILHKCVRLLRVGVFR